LAFTSVLQEKGSRTRRCLRPAPSLLPNDAMAGGLLCRLR
jgi:hypothetical protein